MIKNNKNKNEIKIFWWIEKSCDKDKNLWIIWKSWKIDFNTCSVILILNVAERKNIPVIPYK